MTESNRRLLIQLARTLANRAWKESRAKQAPLKHLKQFQFWTNVVRRLESLHQ